MQPTSRLIGAAGAVVLALIIYLVVSTATRPDRGETSRAPAAVTPADSRVGREPRANQPSPEPLRAGTPVARSATTQPTAAATPDVPQPVAPSAPPAPGVAVNQPPGGRMPAPGPGAPAVQPVAPNTPPGSAPGAPAPVPAAAVEPGGVLPEVENVRYMLRDFRAIEGENPIGTNAEITRALMGGNKKGAQLLAEGTQLNGNGEMVDRWGSPYFFHQLSKLDMEIRSAGPDRVMWTDDDVITK